MSPSQVTALKIAHNKPTRAKNGNLPPIITKRYSYKCRVKNPDFEKGIKFLPVGEAFESCLIHAKSSKNPVVEGYGLRVKTAPKWKTYLVQENIDFQTGELISDGLYETNDIKQSNGKKIKKLDSFCAFYQPLYKSKNVTLWFLTFTRANQSRLQWKVMVQIVNDYFKRSGIPVRGYLWTAEVSESLHFHYHLCIATNRADMRGKHLPELLKFQDLWGQRTEVDFVKKNVRHYMAKYFAKCNARVMNTKSFGASNKFK